MVDISAGDLDAQKFAGTAEAYASSFALLCAGAIAPLLDAAGLGFESAPGVRVLDVGTGTGAVARRVADRGANVVAIDPDEGMRRLAAAAAPTVHVHAGAVPGLPFDDGEFDAVLANFVVNNLSQPHAGVRDMARVTASDGKVGATIWPRDRGALDVIWSGVAAAAGAAWPPRSAPIARDFPRTPAGLAALLAEAGLVNVEARLLLWDTHVDPDRLWDEVTGGVASIGRLVTALPANVRSRTKAAYDRLVEPHRDADEIVLPTVAILATGIRP